MSTTPLTIFDLDGTLLNTLQDLAGSVNATMQHFGFPQRSHNEVRAFLGNGYRYLLQCALPKGVGEAQLNAALTFFKTHYEEHCLDQTRPYDGIEEALESVRKMGWNIAIVSNKGHAAASDLCARFFPGVLTLGESAANRRKPAPDMVYAAMRHFNASPALSVYIGDSEVDLATASAAGLPCLSCLWGFRNRDMLEASGATHFVNSPAEIPSAIGSLIAQNAE